MEENKKTLATEQVESTKSATAEKFESFKAEASTQLNAAITQLDEFKDQLIAKAQEVGKDIDIEGLKVQATEQFEAAKAATAETMTHLQAQAETTFAAATAKADELADVAEDKFDDLKAEATEQLEAAQVKLEALKAEAAIQLEVAKEKAKGFWDGLFGK